MTEQLAAKIRRASEGVAITSETLTQLATAAPSEAIVRAALAIGRTNLDRAPADAERLFVLASRVISSLDATKPALASSLRGHASKGRAMALRMLGNYRAALDELTDAHQHFLDAHYCPDELARVQYSRATILFKMERWQDAALAAAHARQLFEVSNDPTRVVFARIIAGCIAVERGELDAGRRTFLEVERTLSHRSDTTTLVRVWQNLATCELRRGDTAAAATWLAKAREGFRRHGMTTELPRVRWCGAQILLREGDRRRGLRELRAAVREFQALEMHTDAAFVALDLLASIVVAGKRNVEAERLSRELVTTFSRAGVAVSVAQALAYLRDAIIERRAEESLVRYVERYFRRIEIDPHAAFAPEAAPRPPN